MPLFKRLIKSFFYGALLLHSMIFALASELSIESVYVKEVTENNYLLTVHANILMSQEQIQALENGIPLIFVYNISLKERGIWSLFNNEKVNVSYRYQLTYHGLAKQYVVKDIRLNKQASYPLLTLALSHIAAPENIPLAIKNDTKKARLQGGVRLWLDIEALPTPLRLPAYLSKEWRLNTGWKYWEIN